MLLIFLLSMEMMDIDITEEAYNRLIALRKNNENFSDIIMRITGKRAKLCDFHGVISGTAADALEDSIKESREIHRMIHEKRLRE